jgi:hypothetical protein
MRASPTSFGVLGAALVATGLVDLVLGRLILAVLGSTGTHGSTETPRLAALVETLWAPVWFARGMALVLTVSMTIAAALDIMRDPEWSPPPRRLVVLVLSAIALPVLMLSLFLALRPEVVFLALSATAFVGVTGAVSTSLRRLPFTAKLASSIVTMTVVVGYLDTVSRVAPGLSFLSWPGGASLAIEASAVLGGFFSLALLPRGIWRSPTAPFAVSVAVALVPTIGFAAMALLSWPLTQGLAFRALGIGLEVPYAQALYLASLFCFLLTTSFHLWPRPQPGGVPEIGLALASLFFAGLGTYTPFRIGFLLFGLVALALGTHRLSGLMGPPGPESRDPDQNPTRRDTVTPLGT